MKETILGAMVNHQNVNLPKSQLAKKSTNALVDVFNKLAFWKFLTSPSTT
jgi:hypothetical protein